jgi:hypothetical protein
MQRWLDLAHVVGAVLTLVAALVNLVTAVVSGRRDRRDS